MPYGHAPSFVGAASWGHKPYATASFADCSAARIFAV